MVMAKGPIIPNHELWPEFPPNDSPRRFGHWLDIETAGAKTNWNASRRK